MRQLLNHVIDELATAEPEAPCFEIPVAAKTYQAGFREVTRQQFASAVDGVAWWLEKTLGLGTDCPALAYVGPWDVRYNVLLFGAVKAGYKMVFPSPQNSISGSTQLLNSLNCEILLTTTDLVPITVALLETQKYRRVDVPDIEDMLATDAPHYSFRKTFEQARDEPLVVLHTSGSTGLPKPIIWTHGWAASFLTLRNWAPPSGFILQEEFLCNKRLFSLFAPWASGGLFLAFRSLVSQITQVWPISAAAPSAQLLINGLENNRDGVDTVCVGPSIIEEIAESSKIMEYLSQNVRFIYWAGGGITESAGRTLSGQIKLFQSYGSAESGMPTLLRPNEPWDNEEWMYIRIHPRYGIEFRHYTDNLYEAVMIRGSDHDNEPTIFKLQPYLNEWPTHDLFTPHPEETGVWRYCSRTDDVLVFTNGHKFNPNGYEQHLLGHSEIRAALMAGTHRGQSSLLIELESQSVLSKADTETVIDRIWPTISVANEACTAQAKIDKSHIIFTKPEKPLPRTDKGTIKRGQALQLYQKELDSLYTATGRKT